LNPQLDQLSFQMQRTLLRIVQEALVNVHRHAAASKARVEGRIIADRVHVIIRDDGLGARVGQNTTSGRGIRGMQGRTYRWGGGFHIWSGPKGTTVHAVWPMRQHAGTSLLSASQQSTRKSWTRSLRSVRSLRAHSLRKRVK